MFLFLLSLKHQKPKFERELPFIPVFTFDGDKAGITNYFDFFHFQRKTKTNRIELLQTITRDIRNNPENISKSVKKLETLERDENNGDASFILGVLNEFGIGMKQNDLDAFKHYQKAAKFGNNEANYRLSLFYRYNFSKPDESTFPTNEAKASTHLQIAAEGNCVSALLSIAQKYRTQNTFPKSNVMAYSSLHNVTSFLQYNFTSERIFAGNPEVQKLNIDKWPKDKTKRMRAYKAFYDNMAKKGDPGASFKLGMESLFKYPANYTKAIEHFKKAQEEGVAFANGFLGLIYSQGNDIKPDIPKALEYFKKGISLGDPISAVEIGLVCINSPNDAEKLNGKLLIQKAAEGKSPRAIGELGLAYLKGSPPFNEDPKKAMKLFNQAAKLGYLPAYLYRAEALNSGLYEFKPNHAFNDLMHFAEHSFLFSDSDKAIDAVALRDYNYAIRIYTGLGDMGSNTAIFNIYAIYKKLGKNKEAKPWFDLLIQNRYNEAILELGEEQLNKGDTVQGTENIRSVAMKNSRAAFILAWEDRYKPASAFKFIDSAVETKPTCILAAILYRIAIVLINIPRLFFSQDAREMITYALTEYLTTFFLITASAVLYILIGWRIKRIVSNENM